ncbi:MAG: hypothetical protein V1806_04920 [Pseudomonadota bacterium]
MNAPATRVGQSWPVLPSLAKGLHRAYLVEAGEVPPCPDPANVDPLKPGAWRGQVPVLAPLPLSNDSSSDLGRQALACLKRLGLWLVVTGIALACSIVDVVR